MTGLTGKFSDFFLGAYALRGGGGGKKERKFQTQASSKPKHAQCVSIGRIASAWPALARIGPQTRSDRPHWPCIGPHSAHWLHTLSATPSRIGPTGPMWPRQARSGSPGRALLGQAPQWPSHWSHWASHWPSIDPHIGPIECDTLNQIAQGVGVSSDNDGHRHSDPLGGRGADRTPFAQVLTMDKSH